MPAFSVIMPSSHTSRLVLASGSARRREIMALLGLPFRVVLPTVDEAALLGSQSLPEEAAVGLALAKAQEAAEKAPASIVVAADTLVVLGRRILGKPSGPDEAFRMLRHLRARRHRVITGVAVVAGDALYTGAETTAALMRRYSDEEIADYVASGDPMDKAGAYAIQSQAFAPVAAVEGCYLNVVGLPLCLLAFLLKQAGQPVPNLPFGASPADCALCAERRATAGIAFGLER